MTGVDTVGRGRARSEYAQIVVLWREFWLQSMKILPLRSALLMFDSTRSAWCFSISLADRERERRRVLVGERRLFTGT